MTINFDVCVIGLGYIGLPTAVMFANSGLSVWGVDINEDALSSIRAGKSPFYEPDFAPLLSKSIESKNLQVAATPQTSDAFIIAVPTPFKGDHEPDLKYVKQATVDIAPFLKSGNIVILESTSPPGTTKLIRDIVADLRPDLPLDGEDGVCFAHCPERVLPGNIVKELRENDRIVGGLNSAANKKATELYKSFVDGKIYETTAATAELSKLAENSYRDVNIAFANELSMICEDMNVDPWELISLANKHPRVNILQPGPGVGGHCIAVDPWFIVSAAPSNSDLIRTARAVNHAKTEFTVQKIIREIKEKDAHEVFLLGLSFKKDIDDLRESPAMEIAKKVTDLCPGVHFTVIEPFIENLPPQLANRANVGFASKYPLGAQADLQVILVDHSSFKSVVNRNVPTIDTRGMLNNETQ